MIKGIVPTLAEGGKIKIGGLGEERTSRKGATYRMPLKFDYFVVTTTRRDAKGDLITDDALMAELPKSPDGQCREIPIVVHDDDIDRVFPTTYAQYGGRKLLCRGDGETATEYEFTNDGKRTGRTREVACPCDALNATSGDICKPHGTLHCSIRVPGRAIAGAVYMWRTTSWISIQRMIGSLQQIKDVCGTLCGIPLQLKLEPIQVSPKDAQASTVYCCHVELHAKDIFEIQRQAIESAKMRQRVSGGYRVRLALPGVDEDEVEQAEVALEFHPQQPEGELAADETDSGEPIGAEQVDRINKLIDQMDVLQDGSGMTTYSQFIGADAIDVEALTARQAVQVEQALAKALATLQAHHIEQPRRASANGDSGEVISTPQVRRMLAIARGSKHNEAELHAWLASAYQIEHFNEIPRATYDEIVERLKSDERLPA